MLVRIWEKKGPHSLLWDHSAATIKLNMRVQHKNKIITKNTFLFCFILGEGIPKIDALPIFKDDFPEFLPV